MCYFFVFRLDRLCSLLTLLAGLDGACFPGPAGFFRTLSRTLTSLPIAPLAFFFSNRLATRSASDDLTCFRASLLRCTRRSPRDGSPARTVTGALGLDVDEAGGVLLVGAALRLVKVLQRCTRSLRFANLSLPSSRATISSTHCVS